MRGRGPNEQPAHDRQDRDHDVQELVGDQVGAVEVEQGPEQEPVHEPGHGDPADGGDPDAPASAGRRTPGRGRAAAVVTSTRRLLSTVK